MACNCVNEMNAMLKERNLNTVIDVPLQFNKDMSDAPAKTAVVTAKEFSHIRGKPMRVFASYCPFCGVKYE